MKELDNLVQAYSDEQDLAGLVELAGCVRINLEHIRQIAEAHPLVAVAWGQAMGLCASLEKFAEASPGSHANNPDDRPGQGS